MAKHSLKICLFFLVLAGLNYQVKGQTNKSATSGIRFLEGTFQAAQAAAKAAKKQLFVEVYLTGCPHCEAIAPIFTEKQVGDFYNTHFVSWKTEANSEASKALQNAKGLTYPEFPLFFFFDAEGNLLHMGTPEEKATKAEFVEEVLTQGKTALKPEERTSNFASRFQNGERDIMFLIKYGKYARAVKEVAVLNSIGVEIGKILVTPEDIKSQTGFYIVQRLIQDFDNPLAQYFFAHLNEFRALYGEKEVKDAGEAIIYHSLYGPKGDAHPQAKIYEMRQAMVKLGVTPSEAASRTLLKELDACMRESNTKKAVELFNQYRQQTPTLGGADYAYLMKYFNEKATDNSYLSEMTGWGASGLKANKPGDMATQITANINLELGEAYRKMGKKAEATTSAQKALENAKLAKMKTQPFEELLEKVKKM